MEKVVVEQSGNASQNSLSASDSFVSRRAVLTRLYHTLPPYGSIAFWRLLEASDAVDQTMPLEVLVKVLREAVVREDKVTQRHVFEIVLGRLQPANEQWVAHLLGNIRCLSGEREALASDLCADLCELLLRALIDLGQHFWEENFLHSLRFARKHVYERFMRREGQWRNVEHAGRRVPQILLTSLERTQTQQDLATILEVRDESAEAALLAVEQRDIALAVISLPTHLRAVVWLVFWEDHSTKTVGELLHISDRTVRNRLRTALAELRRAFETGQGGRDGRDE